MNKEPLKNNPNDTQTNNTKDLKKTDTHNDTQTSNTKDLKKTDTHNDTQTSNTKDLKKIETPQKANFINNMILYHKLIMINETLDKRYKRDNPEMKNISKGQGRIIAILKRKDKISTKALSEILNISVSSLNETLNKLEHKGFVKKVQSEKDKRILLIKLTEKGKEVKFKNHHDLDIFDSLDNNEKRYLDEYLNRLIIELHKKFKEENPENYEKCFNERKEIFEKYFKDQKFIENWYKL